MITTSTQRLACVLADMIDPLEVAHQERLEALSKVIDNPAICMSAIMLLTFTIATGITIIVTKRQSAKKDISLKTLMPVLVAMSLATGMLGTMCTKDMNAIHDNDVFATSTSGGTYCFYYARLDGQWYKVIERNFYDLEHAAYPTATSEIPERILECPMAYRIGTWDEKCPGYRIFDSKAEYDEASHGPWYKSEDL